VHILWDMDYGFGVFGRWFMDVLGQGWINRGSFTVNNQVKISDLPRYV
jgi:hypothetical protein